MRIEDMEILNARIHSRGGAMKNKLVLEADAITYNEVTIESAAWVSFTTNTNNEYSIYIYKYKGKWFPDFVIHDGEYERTCNFCNKKINRPEACRALTENREKVFDVLQNSNAFKLRNLFLK